MKTLQTLRNASMATFAVAALSLPTLAHASDNNRGFKNQSQACKSDEGDAKLIGGLLGAVIGGVVGSEIAGKGDRNEGAVIGALVGGLAGVGIGDESINCDKRRRRAYNRAYKNKAYTTPSYKRAPVYQNGYKTITYPAYYPPKRVNYGYDTRRNDTRAQLYDVRHRLQKLNREDRRLDRKLQYAHDHRLERRRDYVHDEIRRLERKERRLEKRLYKKRGRSY